jgi:hypothetical protein
MEKRLMHGMNTPTSTVIPLFNQPPQKWVHVGEYILTIMYFIEDIL